MADKELNETYLTVTRKWQCNEKVACAQLAQVVSDSLLICIMHHHRRHVANHGHGVQQERANDPNCPTLQDDGETSHLTPMASEPIWMRWHSCANT